jgi:hypothetical protein
MDDLFRPSPGGALPEHEPTEATDPFLARRVERRPWELRSAQYRAWSLAELAFGDEVQVRLVGRPGYPGFRGLLYLTVPFADLYDHELRQARFLEWAGLDPVLQRVPLVFVFEPNPVVVP